MAYVSISEMVSVFLSQGLIERGYDSHEAEIWGHRLITVLIFTVMISMNTSLIILLGPI